MSGVLLAAASLLIGVGDAGAAAAAEAAVAGSHPDDITVTGTRLRRDDGDAAKRPGGTDIVEAEEYENKLAVSLREALAFSPGVYAQPRFGQEVRLSIRGSGLSRGFHMRGIALLQDGIPINLADDNGDFQEFDPLVFDRIQVYRGSNGLRFGGSTLGGAINATTPTGRSAHGVDLRLDGGSYRTLRGKAAFGVHDETGDVWLAVTGDRSAGEREHARRRSLRFHGNAGVHLTAAVETRFYASAQTIDQELPGALTLGRALDRPRSGNFAGDQKRDVDSLRLQNRTTMALGAVRAEIGGFVNAKQLFHPIFQVIDQDSTDYGLFGRLEWTRGPFDLTLGGTARFGTIDSRRFANVAGRRGARTLIADQEAHTINLYGEGRYAIGALSLIAGGIYTAGARAQDQLFPARVSAKAEYGLFSPKLGLIWEPRDAVQVYANYSRSAELPGFGELAQVAAFVPLAAQRGWTAEAGARGRIGIASFDVALYRSRLRGELLQFTVGPDIPASTFNAGRTIHQGIEAGLELDLAAWARLRQVYQLNDFRFSDDPQYHGNRLPVVPVHLYRAELRLGRDGLHVAPHLEWVPKGAFADYRNSLRVDGYAIAGISGEAEVRDGISLFVDVRNLANKKAVGDISAVIAATPASAIFYPIEGRAVFGGVRAHF
jgi:iron complex outermembrane receptor protein